LFTPDWLDVESLERLLEHVLAGGVHGVFIMGTTGEGPGLGLEVARELITRTGALLRGRMPLLVGVTHTSTHDSLRLAETAAEAGADAVVTAGPCYFPIGQEDLVRWVERYARASPLPVFLYNMPSHAHVSFADESVLRIAAKVPNVVGIKDSSGDLMYLHGLVRAMPAVRPDFSLIIGPEELTAEAVLFGAHGGVNGGANLFPKLYVDVYRAATAGDLETLRRLQAKVIDLSRRLYGSNYLCGIKCAAAELGLIRNVLAAPYEPFEGERRERIRMELADLTQSI
jgi:4-hydroxy-tetrahydrodipicolinate synthase